VQQEFDDREAAAAEKAALKAQKDAEREEKKKKRKSVADGTDIEMGDADDDKKPKSAKKRKKDAESDAEGGKVSLAADCLRCRCRRPRVKKKLPARPRRPPSPLILRRLRKERKQRVCWIQKICCRIWADCVQFFSSVINFRRDLSHEIKRQRKKRWPRCRPTFPN
jgi:hypothetical protein